jgi:cholesterol oxidase
MQGQYDYDFIVVGSGFGGSVCALRLTEKGYRVAVIEMGRRWTPDNLPKTTWSLWNWLWLPKLGMHGFFSMRLFRHVMVLHGNAVGGGSIVYGNTLMVPPDKVWNQGTWAGLNDWLCVLPEHYATAKHMLGVTTNRILGPADLRPKEMATLVGAEKSFYKRTLPCSSETTETTAAKPTQTRSSAEKDLSEIAASAAAGALSAADTTPRTHSIRTTSISPRREA